MTVSLDDVRRIAALARLGVADARLPALARELSGILDHMTALSQVDLTPLAEDSPEGTPWRADRGPPDALRHPLSAFAPEMRDGFFTVPRLATHSQSHAEPGAGDGA